MNHTDFVFHSSGNNPLLWFSRCLFHVLFYFFSSSFFLFFCFNYFSLSIFVVQWLAALKLDCFQNYFSQLAQATENTYKYFTLPINSLFASFSFSLYVCVLKICFSEKQMTVDVSWNSFHLKMLFKCKNETFAKIYCLLSISSRCFPSQTSKSPTKLFKC